MSNVIRFPGGRQIPAATISREQFEELAGLALDVVDRILELMDAADSEAVSPNARVPSSAIQSEAPEPWHR